MPGDRRDQINSLLSDSQLLREIFGSIQDGIMVVGEDEIVAYTNPSAEKLLGLAHESLVGVKAEEIPLAMYYRGGEEMLPESKPFAAAFSNGTIKGPTQVILKRPDGSTLPVLFNVRRKGRGLTIAILTDNSEMMRRQQQQDDYYRLLAHDIRTPLTVILGHAEVLQGTIKKDTNQSIRAILDAGSQMEVLTDEMTDRMQLESGHFDLRIKEIELEEVIEDVVYQYNYKDAKSRIKASIQELPRIKADIYRIKRVLHNLISNAIKYSPENTDISITAWENTKGVMVTVSDQGRGIESHDLPYVFDSFYITSVGKEKGGVGLGLYISRLIIEAHGGRIYISSTENGTTFAIFLPKG